MPARLALLLCLLPSVAQAETYHFFPAAKPQMVSFKLGGDFTAAPRIGEGWVVGDHSNLSMEFGFDFDANTMTYGRFRLDEPDGLRIQNKRVAYNALGEVVDRIEAGGYEVVSFIWFDPFSVESLNTTTVDLVPTGEGTYDIVGPPHILGGPLTLTGHYTAEGPTGTAAGPASVTFDDPFVQYDSLTVIAADYPSIRLHGYRAHGGEPTATFGDGGTVFEAQVEGHPVVAGVESLTYLDLPVYVYLVPEPGTLVMLLIALVCCAVHLRTHLPDRRAHRR